MAFIPRRNNLSGKNIRVFDPFLFSRSGIIILRTGFVRRQPDNQFDIPASNRIVKFGKDIQIRFGAMVESIIDLRTDIIYVSGRGDPCGDITIKGTA